MHWERRLRRAQLRWGVKLHDRTQDRRVWVTRSCSKMLVPQGHCCRLWSDVIRARQFTVAGKFGWGS